MAFNTVKTIFNIGLSTAKMLNVEYTPLSLSTLNEYFNLNIPLNNTLTPSLEYWGIGLRYDDILEENGLSINEISRDPTDIYLQRPIPFLARLKSIGLTNAELEKYRLIVEREVNGNIYYLCYLKKLDKSTDMGYYNIEYDGASYKPTKMDSLDVEENAISRKIELIKDKYSYIGYRSIINLFLEPNEITNIQNAINLLYPDINSDIRYNIGEIALVTGYDVNFNNRLEIACAQSAWYFNTYITLNKLVNSQNRVNIEQIDIGGMQMRFRG